MAPFNLRFEMGKFFLYCLFPVGSLYVYNRPELQESFLFRDQMHTYNSMELFHEDPAKLNKVPKSQQDIDAYLKEYKEKMRKAKSTNHTETMSSQ